MAIVITVGRLRTLLEILIREGEAIDADKSKELLKKFPKGMAKLGLNVNKIDSLPVLGTGTRGTALDIGGGKVLKVTNDDKEAEAASALVGKDIKNVVHFYAVWRFGDTGFFGILQEKLQPLPKDEAKAFNNALVATGLPIWIKRAEGSWDNAKKLTKEFIVSQVKKKYGGNLNSPEAQEFVKDINSKWNALVTKYGLRDMFNTLTELGIDFHDYHAGNMMTRDDGTLVLIDLGMSNVRGGGKINTITERRKK
jgi:hypothetical protein